jgi:hypothetical protein
MVQAAFRDTATIRRSLWAGKTRLLIPNSGSLTQECQDIATQLSAQTGHTWTLAIQDPEHWHRLYGPDSACVNLHRVWNHAERLSIKGVFPQGPNREDHTPPNLVVRRLRCAPIAS